MPIHEESLIRPENLKKHEELSIDDVDVSGHWSTFIESRSVSDYNENLEEGNCSISGWCVHTPMLAMWSLYKLVYGERYQS